ncbi:MAG: polysaccharide biosynthesis/export family protein [Chitinivibrionales bacterium]|nr:polysaccharide biosynthesis/export family protein [Chitinivibrionales bacterium]
MPCRKIFFCAIAAFCAIFPIYAAQAANPAPAEAPAQKKTTPAESTVIKQTAPPAALPPFHAGDALLITTFPDTATFFRGLHRIDDQGCVDLPAIGKLRVIDKTEKQLADTLVVAYVNYLRYPVVQVHPLIRVSLLGGFYRPGLYWVPPSYSLWDVVSMGGGTQREDGIKNLRWERSRALIKKDLVEDFQSGSSLQKMGLLSGDQLWATSKLKKDFWEVMTTNVLPWFTVTATLVSTSITAYQFYALVKAGRL